MTTRGNSAPGVRAPMQTRSIADLLEAYDRLPAAYRRFVRDCAFNIDVANLETLPIAELRRRLRFVEAQSALSTYGPDHPQAGRS